MTNVKNLYIWPWPLPSEDRDLLIARKAALKLDFLVMPTEAFPIDQSGMFDNTGGARVLCLREQCPMFADHAFVPDPTNEASLLAAMDWVLNETVDSRASTKESMWAKLGYREIPASQLRFENLSQNLTLNDGVKVPMFRETFDD